MKDNIIKQSEKLQACIYPELKRRVCLCLRLKKEKYQSESHLVTCAVIKLLEENGF